MVRLAVISADTQVLRFLRWAWVLRAPGGGARLSLLLPLLSKETGMVPASMQIEAVPIHPPKESTLRGGRRGQEEGREVRWEDRVSLTFQLSLYPKQLWVFVKSFSHWGLYAIRKCCSQIWQ